MGRASTRLVRGVPVMDKNTVRKVVEHALRFAHERSTSDTMARNIETVAKHTLHSARWLCGPKARVERVLCDTSTGAMHCVLSVPASMAPMLELMDESEEDL